MRKGVPELAVGDDTPAPAKIAQRVGKGSAGSRALSW